ncbi:MAG: prepilin-type N-terminal cleavage/methylation domain-containing protein [Planctomycetaceae bacterium]|nr:prepilin-type N-terminal cleavage/methylation domain-containing protein [Planctomycetales bacterium]MCB9923285.1 prepilin-type N-terminal cleavage/methylation domain-containing protein [Planctomycetaceae bacterium]
MKLVKSGGHPARYGFSLLELLAVVTIIAVISSIVVPRIAFHVFSAKEKACSQYRGDLNSAVERYMFDHNAPPAQLSDLQVGNYYPGEIPKCPADHTDYVLDAATHRITGHNH